MKIRLEDLELQGDSGMRSPESGVPFGEYRWRLKHKPSGLATEATHSDEEMDRGPWSIVELVLGLADGVEKAASASAAPVTHIAAFQMHVGQFRRQVCAWCGETLIEYDLALVAVPSDQPGEPAMWPPGHYVHVDGGMSVDVGDETVKAPDDVCWLREPAVAAVKARDKAREAEEAAERQRIHDQDNLLLDCQVDVVGEEDGASMKIVHKATGLTVSADIEKTELDTRNRLLSELNDKLREQDAAARTEVVLAMQSRADLLKQCRVSNHADGEMVLVHNPTAKVVRDYPRAGEQLAETKGRLADLLYVKLKQDERDRAGWYERADARHALLCSCTVSFEPHDGVPWATVRHTPSGMFESAEVQGTDLHTRDLLLDKLLARLDEQQAEKSQEWSTADPPKNAGPQHNHVSSGVYGGCPACGTTEADLLLEGDDEVFTPSTPNPETQDPPEANALGDTEPHDEAEPPEASQP